MPANAAAANVLGTMGAICWSGQLIPQIWKSWREKATEGLSEWLVLLWSIAAIFLGVFVIIQNLNIPLIVQPQLFGFLSLVSWGQCMYYGRKKSRRFVLLIWTACLLVFGAFEVGMVFAVRPAVEKGNERAVQFFGIFSSVIISLGLFPQYVEIWKYREVKGISLTFMAIDLFGGVFSDLSLAFSPNFDVIAAITYSLVVVLDGVVIVAAIILNPLAKKKRARQALEAGTEIQAPTTLSSPDSGEAEMHEILFNDEERYARIQIDAVQ